MNVIFHPILGPVDLSQPGYWATTVSHAGRDVTFSLVILEEGVTAEAIESLPRDVAEFEALDRAARRAILEDAESGGEDSSALLYLTHHHAEVPPGEFRRLFGADQPGPANLAELLARLVLVRVGLNPESRGGPIVLDYTIGKDVTDYVLCVSFEESRRPVCVCIES